MTSHNLPPELEALVQDSGRLLSQADIPQIRTMASELWRLAQAEYKHAPRQTKVLSAVAKFKKEYAELLSGKPDTQ